MTKKKMANKKAVSNYLLDYNKRQLESFFHPNKYPKAALSVSAMAILLFLLVANYSPLKNKVYNALYPKPASQASESPQVMLDAPMQVKIGQEFRVTISSTTAETFSINIKYSKHNLRALRIDTTDSDVKSWQEQLFDNNMGQIQLSGLLSGKNPSSLIGDMVFKATQIGQASLQVGNDKEVLINITN